MAILKIAKLGHPILHKKAENADKMVKKDLRDIVVSMSATLMDSDGVGLAAPQIHISKRIIIFCKKRNEENEKLEISVLVNPSYKNISNETIDDWEGCLSIPGMLGKVRRHNKIIYQGYDLKGNFIKKEAEGFESRVIQHECDHLEGILYTSRLIHPKLFGFVEEINKYHKI